MAAIAQQEGSTCSVPSAQATSKCQPKKQGISNFFHQPVIKERRSRSVAPAGEIAMMNHSVRRSRASVHELEKARERSLQLRRAHRLRCAVGEFMQQLYVELFFVMIVLLYGIFVVLQISIGDEELKPYKMLIDVTDITVGSILLIEICLKIFAFGMEYLQNGWSLFDAVVIVASFVMGIVAAWGTSSDIIIRILRMRVLLRILRVLVVFERLKQRTRTMKFSYRGPMTSPLEHVLHILGELRYHPALRASLRNDVEFAINTIKNNRLYEATADILAQGVDDDTQNWLRGEVLKSNDAGKELQEFSDGEISSNLRNGNVCCDSEPIPERTISGHIKEVDPNRKHSSGSSPFRRGSTMIDLLPQLNPSDDVELSVLCKNVSSWKFDIFRVHSLTGGNALTYLGHLLLSDLAITALKIERTILMNFLVEIQVGYIAENPYHNAIHAADVMQTVHYFLCQPELTSYLRPLDRALALVAAGIHDFKHDGFNNSFHITTASDIALRYNDHAVLENFHVAQSFLVMKNSDCNILAGLPSDEFKYAREILIQMVLATDMAKHFEDVTLFKANILPSTHDETMLIKNIADKKLLLKMVLHTCDVSNPAKELEIMLKWTDRVVEEFFIQGDLEKQLSLPPSPFMDRDTIVLKKMQLGFADFIVVPLFTVWAQIIENVDDVAYKMLLSNREFWSSLSDDFKPHMIKDVLREYETGVRTIQNIDTTEKSPQHHGSPRKTGIPHAATQRMSIPGLNRKSVSSISSVNDAVASTDDAVS